MDTAPSPGVRLVGHESWTKAGQTAPSEFETDDVVFCLAVPLEREVSQNGLPLTVAAERKQDLQLAKQEKALAVADHPPGGDPPRQLLDLNGEIWTFQRFESRFQWSATEVGPGRVELNLQPRPGLKARTRMERVLQNMTGILEVNPASGQILSGSFRTLRPVKFGIGLLADFQFSGSFQMQPAGHGWVRQTIVIHVNGRELWRRLDGVERIQYQLVQGR